MGDELTVADLIGDELRLIRRNVPGVRGSITATTDALLVTHDMHGIEPTQIAALVAAAHAVAVRASLTTECGQLKELITRGTDGYLAVYSAGGTAIVAVLGVSDMNVAMLNFQARKMIDRIAEYSATLSRGPRPVPAQPAEPAAPAAPEPGGDGEPLPARGPDGD